MKIRGIIFLIIALMGVVLNFTSRSISEKTQIKELNIKITALIIVFVAIVLLFIFGK